jgi:predicted lipid-binding transport protein (Tim44 family)
MVAAFLVLRLRSVLGRRTGFERPPQQDPRPGAAGFDPRAGAARPGAESAAEGPCRSRRPPPPRRRAPAQRASPIRAPRRARPGPHRGVDRGFDPQRFLDGAQAAFGMIVQAFAAGDRQTLRSLLSTTPMPASSRRSPPRAGGRAPRTRAARGFNELAIEGADLRGTTADVTVRFVTDQVNMTTGRNGEVVAGSDAVTELTDVWTFQRDLQSADPTWRWWRRAAPDGRALRRALAAVATAGRDPAVCCRALAAAAVVLAWRRRPRPGLPSCPAGRRTASRRPGRPCSPPAGAGRGLAHDAVPSTGQAAPPFAGPSPPGAPSARRPPRSGPAPPRPRARPAAAPAAAGPPSGPGC